MTDDAGMTAEQGRALQARARRFSVLARIGQGAVLLAIVAFVASIFELRGIDADVAAGGASTTPYAAYGAIALFAAGAGLAVLGRWRFNRIARVLADEQLRRDIAAADNGEDA